MIRNLLTIFAFILLIVLSFKYFELKNANLTNSEKFVYSNGRIEATQVDITPKITGKLLKVYVKEGDFVEKNQIIAKLDTKELEAKYQAALFAINQVKENKNYQIALLDQKNSELKLAKENYERSKKLYKTDSISQLQYHQDETTYNSTKAALQAIKAAVSAADASISSAIAEAEVIKTNLDESVLYSPVEGRVLYKLYQDGEMIFAGQKVAVVLDILDTYMNIFLPTSQAGVVGYDTQVRVVLDAYPNIALPAKVTYISPQAQFTPKQIETKDEREKLMFKVKASIDYDLLKTYIKDIRVGLPGVSYIKLDNSENWPEFLENVPKYNNK